MPVVSFANSKGGSGKTTAALLLANRLALEAPTIIIDADPRQPITSWATKAPISKNLRIINDVNETTIFDTIEEAAKSVNWVIVDLEGTASVMTGVATTSSDQIVVPCLEMQQDAEAAVQVIKRLEVDFKNYRRRVPFSVLFSRTKQVKSRTERFINTQFRSSKVIPCMETELMFRDAYSAIFARGGSLYDMAKEDVSNLDKAKAEVERLALEIMSMIQKTMVQEQAGAA